MTSEHSPGSDPQVAQWAQRQELLLDLLREDMESAFTLLETTDPKRRWSALERARTTLRAVRLHVDYITDFAVREQIQASSHELEAAIKDFQT